jgi:hypothetical protein
MRNNDLRRGRVGCIVFSRSQYKQPYKPMYDFTISARKPTLPAGRQSFGEPFPT